MGQESLQNDAGTPAATASAGSVRFREIARPAARKGFFALLDLAKVIAPVYFAVALLNYTGLVTVLANFLKPAMHLFGLPGEAAVVLLTGWLLSIYAALGALKALHLSSYAITALALIVLICHALPMEWAVLHKMGARATRISIIRFVVSLLAGAAYALLYREQMAVAPPAPAAAAAETTKTFLPFLLATGFDCAKLLGLVLAIIVPATVLSEWLRAKNLMPKIANIFSSRLGRFNPGEGTILPLLIGLIFGIVYGGGAMIGLSQAGVVKPSEARTVGLFLGLCHSMIEDPAVYIAIGASWFWLLIVRTILAIILTPLLRRFA